MPSSLFLRFPFYVLLPLPLRVPFASFALPSLLVFLITACLLILGVMANLLFPSPRQTLHFIGLASGRSLAGSFPRKGLFFHSPYVPGPSFQKPPRRPVVPQSFMRNDYPNRKSTINDHPLFSPLSLFPNPLSHFPCSKTIRFFFVTRNE